VTLLISFLAGALVARLAWSVLRPMFAGPVFAGANHRGATVPTAVGIVIALAVIAVEAARGVAVVVGLDARHVAAQGSLLVVVAVVGFCLLGALDDLVGTGYPRGFHGHLRALAQGELTTGSLKLVGGALVALVVTSPIDAPHVVRLGVDAALVALAANLFNLLDRAPGRAIKVGGLSFGALALASGATVTIASVGAAVGAAVGLLREDLRERLMLGDAGANALGAAVGLGFVIATTPSTRLVVLLVLVGLSAANEVVSFSKVIDRVGPLRALDRLGGIPRSDDPPER
jgi:UDP-N-acetylmuramyl pentapeptide phosphotransferase/UDP-N-acetylglucosamine-1-phosphate transferase